MVFPAADAERAVEALHAREAAEVGNPGWMRQHLALQRLNLQAHESVQSNSDNFVLDALVTFDKLGVIVHELLVIEAWREHVLSDPAVLKRVATHFSIRGYHTVFQEAAICNLLEVVLYHDYAAQACGDMLLELVDYCCRRVRWLARAAIRAGQGGAQETALRRSGGRKSAATAEDADELDQDENARRENAGGDSGLGSDDDEAAQCLEDFKRQLSDIEWRCSVAAVSILRFLCEHVTQLPLGVMTRLLDTHDVPCLVIPLIENPPWTRRTERGTWEKLKDHKWAQVPPQDLLLLTPLEAQPWLVLFNLLCEGEVRSRYPFHSFRKDSILRIRKYLNPTLVDQLPVLSDLQRTLDELVIMDAPPATKDSRFVMEQVAEVRDKLLASTDWSALKKAALEDIFAGKEARDDPLVLELAGLYGDDHVEALLSGTPAEADPAQEVIAPPAAPARRGYPASAKLFLQTGAIIDLAPVSQQGTVQETSKGAFTRYQLRLASDSQVASLDIDLDLPDLVGSILKLEFTDSLGEGTVVFSKPIKASQATGSEFWLKLGALRDGALAQVQCTLAAEEGRVTLGSVFLSCQGAATRVVTSGSLP